MSDVSAHTATRAERVEDAGPVTRAVTVWFATIIGPTAAWAVHLVALASLTRFTCTSPRWTWSLHAITAATLAVALACTALSWRLLRLGDDEAAYAPPGRLRFLGMLGVGIGAFNVLLIVVEELLVIGLHGTTCG